MSPTTHKRKHKVQPNHQPHAVNPKPKNSAAILMAIFIGLVGLAIGGYASGAVSWAIGSAAIGVIAGALIGHGIDRSIAKR